MKKGSVIDAFVEGARNGFQIAVHSTIPNIIFAFALIQVLELTGALVLIGQLFRPVMVIFGLPGVAATVLMGAWLSMGGGVGIASGLIAAGELTGAEATILLPAIYLIGSQVQYLGRILGTAALPTKYNLHMFLISLINAALAMLTMRLFV